jgi:ribosome-associated toxin RatA of RatAB toxin-antitoxin module
MASWQITDNQFDFSISHRIEATPETVYRVLAEMDAYPEFVNDLISVKREGEVYHFVARAALLTIPATLRVSETPIRSVAFELVEGPIDALSGRWLIEHEAGTGQTNVTLSIHAETGPRGEWLLRMTAKFVENKTDKLIAAFSERVLEMERGGVPPARPAIEPGLFGWFKRLWQRLFGRSRGQTAAPQAAAASPAQISAKPVKLFREEHAMQTLEALATTMLPPDDIDEGVKDMGFVSVVEMRARYETGREEIYATALKAVDKLAQARFNKAAFVDLTLAERTALMEAIRQDKVNSDLWSGPVKPSTFFSALWEDVSFLYCTHPDSWQRIGFPGPSFEAGGYQDFDQPQEFLGQDKYLLKKQGVV